MRAESQSQSKQRIVRRGLIGGCWMGGRWVVAGWWLGGGGWLAGWMDGWKECWAENAIQNTQGVR